MAVQLDDPGYIVCLEKWNTYKDRWETLDNNVAGEIFTHQSDAQNYAEMLPQSYDDLEPHSRYSVCVYEVDRFVPDERFPEDPNHVITWPGQPESRIQFKVKTVVEVIK